MTESREQLEQRQHRKLHASRPAGHTIFRGKGRSFFVPVGSQVIGRSDGGLSAIGFARGPWIPATPATSKVVALHSEV